MHVNYINSKIRRKFVFVKFKPLLPLSSLKTVCYAKVESIHSNSLKLHGCCYSTNFEIVNVTQRLLRIFLNKPNDYLTERIYKESIIVILDKLLR